MTALGPLLLLTALVAAIYGAVTSVHGLRRKRPEFVRSGQHAVLAVFALVAFASLSLLFALYERDYNYAYVVGHVSNTTPWYYRLSAFYSGQQGSLLYWALMLSVFSAIVVIQNRRRHPELLPYVIATLMSVEGFFLLVLVFAASPFDRVLVPVSDGQGLNPLLQDPGMLIHPPMLLAGLMSWTVPFAFVIAALLSGRLDTEWIQATRRYALVAWFILGAGNLLGAWWSYHVLGWGGYWGWDPVENGAIMPWFCGTAYLHSVMIQERRGMLKIWNVTLLLLAFSLSIFGTFVVRSGVITSVHSFAQSSIGPYFFVFLLIVIAFSLGLLYLRIPALQSENGFDSVFSREGTFLLNNLLFLGIVFATFWGTILPIVSDALRNVQMTVGPPFFNQVNGPIALALVLLMGIGPLLPWRHADRRRLGRSFSAPVAATVFATVVLWLVGVRDWLALIGLSACFFVIATVVLEFYNGIRARRHYSRESIPLAAVRLIRRSNRRYGGYVVHLAIVLIGVGVIGSTLYKDEQKVVLRPGQSVQAQDFRLTFSQLQHTTGADTETVTAPVLVSRGHDTLGTLYPARVTYLRFPGQPPMAEAAIDTIHLKDLYVVLSDTSTSGSADLLIFVNPLVALIWAGGPLLLLGFLICFWPEPRFMQRAEPVPRSLEVAVEA